MEARQESTSISLTWSKVRSCIVPCVLLFRTIFTFIVIPFKIIVVVFREFRPVLGSCRIRAVFEVSTMLVFARFVIVWRNMNYRKFFGLSSKIWSACA